MPQNVRYSPIRRRRSGVALETSGYSATIVNGVVTRRDNIDTGARPGRLVRGAR